MRKLTTFFLLVISLSTVHGQFCSTTIDTVSVYAEHQETIFPDHIQSKFELHGGLIFVKPKLWGIPQNFILDTGAPCLVLNSKYKFGSAKRKAYGINGDLKVCNVNVTGFNWRGLSSKSSKSVVVDVSHIEQIKNESIAGFIGFDYLQDYEVMIDYELKKIDAFKPKTTAYHSSIQPIGEIPFVMREHFAIIKVKIGNKVFEMALDTGAETNLLSLKAKKRIKKEHVYNKTKQFVNGFGRVAKKAESAKIDKIKVKEKVFENMDVVFTDFSNFNKMHNLDIDGLLGYPFFSSRKFSINYAEQKLYIWDIDPPAPTEEEALPLMAEKF